MAETPLFSDRPINVCVTGAAGQIAYSLLPLIAGGKVFGPQQQVSLRLLEIEAALPSLQGVVMELEDCAFPLLHSVFTTSDAREAFRSCDVAVLLGAFPRKQGMERKDLLEKNAGIFKEQGEALNTEAGANVRVIVVGNPANTNAYILKHFAPNIPDKNITALTRLDQNRAVSLVARKLGVPLSKVSDVYVWGNHSSTQYPDVLHGSVEGKGKLSYLLDKSYLEETFIPTIQKRGAAVIAARKMSSAMSAANAVGDHLHDWLLGSDRIVSMSVASDGSYGIEKGTIFSFPLRCSRGGTYEIVKGLQLDDFSQRYIKITADELYAEKAEALALLS
uniref:Malate dehydrogenase n=1 Tax=Galdieria sulphuraria TaxID=130081 RepID=Q8H0Q7_GALSU|nr:cytosolic malate dehydrogenase [Galdieria sulphuraria]